VITVKTTSMITEQVNITSAEETFCLYKLGNEGSFMTSLIDTIFKGDDINRSKLAKGYPELVEVCNRYNRESGYWQNLVQRWNKANSNAKLHA
jgi:hypothetical protein